MRKFTYLLLLTFYALSATSQNNAKPRVTWNKGGYASIALAQGGTRNWAPGGDRFSLAVNGFLKLYANRNSGRWNWSNVAETNFGLINTSRAGIIKNDDKIDMGSRVSYAVGKNKLFRVGGLANFRTQFADGYNYDSSVKKRISAFLAPGNFCVVARR